MTELSEWTWALTAWGIAVALWAVRYILRGWLGGRYQREVLRRLDEADMEPEDLREQLAAIEHERWADWQRYVHSKCLGTDTGALVIPTDLVARWERQIATPYADLSEAEKDSDREQVGRYWPLVCAQVSPLAAEKRG